MPGHCHLRGWFAWSLGLLVCMAGLVRVAYLAARPGIAIGAVPDDAFYYLKLADNRVLLGTWTLDGVSTTSGFHLLHAHLLGLVDLVQGPMGGDWIRMLAVVGVIASICLGLAAALVALAAGRAFGSGAWVAPVVLSPPLLMFATMLMESHLVVLAAAATLYVASGTSVLASRARPGVVLLGLLAALTRSDFLLLPLVLWLACALHRRSDPARFQRTGLLLLGGSAGMVVTAAHTWLVSGTLLQSSVRTKLAWTEPGPWTISVVLNVVVLVVVAGHAVLAARRGRSIALLSDPLALGALMSIIGYGALYLLTGKGLQPWYAASLMMPLAFVLAALGARVAPRLRRVVAAVVAVGCLALSLGQLGQQLWPWQIGMLHAAEKLRADPDITHIGSWNAGILSVVSGKQVTNLDGLVDDDAASANEQGRLLNYLRRRQISDVVDHVDAITRQEGGLPDEALVRCLQPVAVLGEPDDPMAGSGPVTLFRLDC
ncbi:MAG: hypothetical protein KDB60_03160 [Propionibacteriaceae bacterium]|nr:hypothetical protein [Propionibacteriaceae bacterium]